MWDDSKRRWKKFKVMDKSHRVQAILIREQGTGISLKNIASLPANCQYLFVSWVVFANDVS